jgi:FlaA1/EpsC-like NDP-sugar epimerase
MFADMKNDEEIFINPPKNIKSKLDLTFSKKQFENKKILVTGGAGSISSEIVKQLLKQNPAVVRVLDIDETRLFEFQNELKKHRNVRFLIGDVRDKDRLKMAVEDIDIIFHAAALKHVPSCEYNPFESVKTNVIGTQNLIEVAMGEEVEKMINISTDKVVNPIGTMGATKLLTERLVIAAEFYKGNRRTIFSSVRFGNVIGTRGSVIPLFKTQIQKNEILTITDPEMTRFVMSINQAVDLIFEASNMAKGGEIFIFKMPSLRIGDLAEVMIEESLKNIKIENTGIRPGEKMYESLMTEEEAEHALETEDMFIILPQIDTADKVYEYKGTKPTKLKKYTSKDVNLMSKDEIRKMLSEEDLL